MTEVKVEHFGTRIYKYMQTLNEVPDKAKKIIMATCDNLKIDVQHISKYYATSNGTTNVLNDVSLQVADGAFVGLVGPTGCGKTTLLKIIAGFEQSTSGSVLVDGKLTTSIAPDRGFVFQQPNLFPWLTVFDNVAFSVRHGRNLYRPVSRRAVGQVVNEYLNAVGLVECADRFPYQISGGMKARTALARVLVAGTPILLMDEPFAALDAFTRGAMQKLILELRERNICRTVILITHDVEEATVLCDEIAIMAATPGRIVGSVTVPFDDNRSYEDVLLSPELLSVKRSVLDRLSPYLTP